MAVAGIVAVLSTSGLAESTRSAPKRAPAPRPMAAASPQGATAPTASSVSTVPGAPAWLPLTTVGLTAQGGAILASRIAAIAVDSTHPGTVYIGGMGGVWKSTDNGLDWLPLTDALPVRAVGALALDPLQSGVLYAGTGDPNGAQGSDAGIGLLRSSDDGQTWSTLGAAWLAGLAISRIEVDPGDSNHLLVAAVTANDSPAGAQPGLYESTDGGSTWTLAEAGEAWDFAWDAPNQTILAVVGTHVYRSSDNGVTFTVESGAALPGVITRAAICPLPTAKSFLLVTADAQFRLGALLTTADDGQSWASLTGPPDSFGPSGAGQGYYDIAVAADPANPRHWWLAGIDVWETSDGGSTWTDISAGTQVAADQHALVAAGGTLWVGNDGGIWSRGAGGFTDLNATLANLATLSETSGTTGLWATSFQNGLAQFSSTGVQLRMAGGGGTVVAGPGSSPLMYFATPQLAALEVSSDGGAKFIPVSSSGSSPTPLEDASRAPWRVPLAVDPAQPLTVYCGTWRVWKSTDGGSTWSVLTGSETSGTITAITVSPLNSNLVWAGTSTGAVLASRDGGTTWNAETATGLPSRPLADLRADPNSATRLWAALAGHNSDSALAGHVFLSDDGGATWTDASGNLPDEPVHRLLPDPLTSGVVYASLDSGVYATGDSGQHWLFPGSGLPAAPVLDLTLDSSRDLLAATFGRGVWKLPLATGAESLTVAAGNNQTAQVQQPLGQPLAVAVTNVFGLPSSGVAVQWSDGGAGGSFSAASTVSDTSGEASVSYTLPSKSGPVTIQATAGSSTVNFTESATPLQPSTLQMKGGDQQSGVASTRLARDLSVRVVDSLGNGVPGISVAFTDNGASGQFTASTVVTDSNGIASVGYTLPSTAGTVTVTASSSGLAAVSFTLTVTPAPNFSLQAPATVPPANQNSIVTVQIATQSIGGDTAPITFTCQTPATGCSFSPAQVTPGQATTLSLGTGSLAAGAADTVVVEGRDFIHAAQTVSFQVTVIAMGLAFGPAPPAATVTAGQSTSVPLSLTPAGGLTGPVQFAVTMANGAPMPTGVSASFSPATLTLTGTAAATDVLKLSTTSRVLALAAPGPRRSVRLWLLLASVALLFLFAGLAPVQGCRRLRPALQSAAVSLLLLATVACGGGGGAPTVAAAPQPKTNPNGTPAGTYNLTVTATAGSVSATTPVVLVVQ